MQNSSTGQVLLKIPPDRSVQALGIFWDQPTRLFLLLKPWSVCDKEMAGSDPRALAGYRHRGRAHPFLVTGSCCAQAPTQLCLTESTGTPDKASTAAGRGCTSSTRTPSTCLGTPFSTALGRMGCRALRDGTASQQVQGEQLQPPGGAPLGLQHTKKPFPGELRSAQHHHVHLLRFTYRSLTRAKPATPSPHPYRAARPLCTLTQKHFLASSLLSQLCPSTRASVRCGDWKKPGAAGTPL